ncbi:DNA mismatch repair protein MutS [Paradesertivirga mongoliensis]|uniref:DNA mismatch repair protein MutS n=1 Tax=Paradesertivirga mongoliensis TaxID=2100740 RepID=A0ABW4ZN73_9SPHI|nr:DNA mismatch repair protein MutS [Pedobacter mongoliensis]
MAASIIAFYDSQASFADQEISRYGKLINTYSFMRLFAILLGGLVIYQVLQYEIIWLVELSFFLLIIGFAFLVKKQGSYERRKQFYEALKAVCENEIASIQEQKNIYDYGAVFQDEAHQYSSDLDIFGKASLFNLVNRCASPLSNERLAAWLSSPATESDITERQEAIKDFTSRLNWVQEFKASLLFARGSDKSEINNLINYFGLHQERISPALRIYVRIVPYLFFILTAAAWFVPFFSVPLFLIAVTNAILVLSNQMKVNKTDRVLNRLGKTLAAYSEAFYRIETERWNSPLCSALTNKLKNEHGKSFSAKLQQLSVLVRRLEYRLNIFAGLFLNGIAAWDVRQLIAIEDWRQENKDLMPGAFEVLSSFEALVSLSSLHSNYPEWVFPEIVSGDKYTYVANELAHPLIPAVQRISNDFSLVDSLKIDIITGSNMAGKSTFLRTVGINAVLAFAGAPVCATSMRVSVMNLFAYMRIRDSLNESISTFKAELNRLQSLLRILDQQNKVYFLIDEMLRGTNSVDKYRGSKAVIEKLVSEEAVGIVATHDLQIARLEDKYPDYIRNFYFDIQVIEGEMFFDYKLKAGECKTFNASLLLKQIGIEVEG